ncbi:MAG: ATP phosphoribosyltransferase regulatory subunit, partial [Anaerolineae bacterium]|nr:ATP phosphoribosyltransferase regulatory subunit [Anaerolineae bacterium]
MTTHIQHIASVLQRHMTLYGYELIDLPIIEPVDLFLIKAGDPIINALFTFERHNRQLALRPEFTAGAAAHYTQLHPNESPAVRWQYSGSIFQDPPGNASSAYQHHSI